MSTAPIPVRAPTHRRGHRRLRALLMALWLTLAAMVGAALVPVVTVVIGPEKVISGLQSALDDLMALPPPPRELPREWQYSRESLRLDSMYAGETRQPHFIYEDVVRAKAEEQ